jgi:hypothetical protein
MLVLEKLERLGVGVLTVLLWGLERFPVVYATDTHHAKTSLGHPEG